MTRVRRRSWSTFDAAPSEAEREVLVGPLRPRTEPRWWDDDRRRHRRDMPRYCPNCGEGILEGGGIAVEYWEGEDRVYHLWCRPCGWAGDVVRVERLIGHEPDH